MSILIDPKDDSLNRVVFCLEKNGIVAFPTETVYGLGGNAYSDVAVAKIYKAKNRPSVNPLIAHYKSASVALSKDVISNEIAEKLAENFWPGPMTLVLVQNHNSKVSNLATAGLKTLAVRVPKNEVAHKLLSMLEFPLVAPSANKSTSLSNTTAEAVCSDFSDIEDLFVIDGGMCNVGVESTIIDVSIPEKITILRYGGIAQEQIEDVCGVKIFKHENSNMKPIAPGMMFKHYAPKHELFIDQDDCDSDDAFLDFGSKNLHLKNVAKMYLDLSPANDLYEAAHNLFNMLRILDGEECARICVAPIENVGIGIAINDKIKRASGKIGRV